MYATIWNSNVTKIETHFNDASLYKHHERIYELAPIHQPITVFSKKFKEIGKSNKDRRKGTMTIGHLQVNWLILFEKGFW